MTVRQTVFTILLVLAVAAFVIDLVRRRRLREEYSWLWILGSFVTLGLLIWPQALLWIVNVSGASKATTTIFMLAIAFLSIVCIHLCTKLTQVNEQTKRLAQHIALIRAQKAI